MKFSFVSLFTKLTLATSVAGVLIGCDDPEYDTPKPETTTTLSSARVLVVNASPGSQAATITVDNASVNQTVSYLSSPSTGYLQVPVGLRQVGVVVPNNVKDASGNVLPGVVRQQFAAGSSYTVFSTDAPTRAGSGTDLGGVRAIVLNDNLAAPAANKAKIRFVNLSSSGTYGIFNSVTQASLFSAVPTRAYRLTNNGTTATSTNYANFTEVDAGSYTVDVRSAATTPLAGTGQALTFTAGKIYTLYVRGVAGSTTTPLGVSTVLHN
ncbi:DUF4397 domain-containing protein [Hymenobacter norwichensis]|uniref:DUF4397 domain-containing protein n=1 Tax=Hymenobacter norwichensis TaxID=223903 RepID=UPI000A0202D8|nr:DUF4397 domain-containing protein [Hymenobacter norwichensis]